MEHFTDIKLDEPLEAMAFFRGTADLMTCTAGLSG